MNEISPCPKARSRTPLSLTRSPPRLPQRQIRIIEHFQEVIAVDDPGSVQSTMLVAPMPAPLLDRCYVNHSLLADLAVSVTFRPSSATMRTSETGEPIT